MSSEYDSISIILQEILLEQKEIRANQTRLSESVVLKTQCNHNREHCPSLTRAESAVIDRARCEDDKILMKMEKIEKDVRSLSDKFVIFNFSRCTLMWIWNNKKGVTALFALLSMWQLAIGWISRLVT